MRRKLFCSRECDWSFLILPTQCPKKDYLFRECVYGCTPHGRSSGIKNSGARSLTVLSYLNATYFGQVAFPTGRVGNATWSKSGVDVSPRTHWGPPDPLQNSNAPCIPVMIKRESGLAILGRSDHVQGFRGTEIGHFLQTAWWRGRPPPSATEMLCRIPDINHSLAHTRGPML